MIKRLFVVVNPTQYLNAIEYVFQQGSGEDHIIIITPYSKGIEAIDALGAKRLWASIQFLDTLSYRQGGSDQAFWLDSWKFLNESFKNLQAADEYVFGNIIDGFIYPFVLKEKKSMKTIIVLDDGTPTLGVAEKRSNGKFYFAYNFRSIRVLLKYMIYLKIFLPIYRPPKKLIFFTMFNLSLPKEDGLIVNGYEWMKSKIENYDVSSEALFIGSHLVDRRLIGKEDYLNSLLLIKSDFESEGRELTYVYHRGESVEMRNAIAQICKTIDFNQPLELVFLNHPKPEVIAGHFSSALFTLSRIFKSCSVRAYLFPEDQILGSEYESKSYLLQVQRALAEDSAVDSRMLSDLKLKAVSLNEKS